MMPLTAHEIAAVIDFIYNVGAGGNRQKVAGKPMKQPGNREIPITY
jgi:GH24 family phage-related lysozyme (muramidase)